MGLACRPFGVRRVDALGGSDETALLVVESGWQPSPIALGCYQQLIVLGCFRELGLFAVGALLGPVLVLIFVGKAALLPGM